MERGEYPKYHPLDYCCDTVMTVVILREGRGEIWREGSTLSIIHLIVAVTLS